MMPFCQRNAPDPPSLVPTTWPASLIAMAKLTRPPGSVPRFRGGGGGGLSKSEARYGPVVSLLKPICESLMYSVKSTTYGPSIPFSLIAIPLKSSRTEDEADRYDCHGVRPET